MRLRNRKCICVCKHNTYLCGTEKNICCRFSQSSVEIDRYDQIRRKTKLIIGAITLILFFAWTLLLLSIRHHCRQAQAYVIKKM